MRCELKAAPPVPIKYTTDGSAPLTNGGLYDGPFALPPGARFVLAAPSKGQGELEKIDIPAEPEKVAIDPVKAYTWKRLFQKDATMESFGFLSLCRKHNAGSGGISVYIGQQRKWIDLSLDDDSYHSAESIENVIETVRGLLPQGVVSLKVTSLYLPSGQNLQEMDAELKETLKPGEVKEVDPKQLS